MLSIPPQNLIRLWLLLCALATLPTLPAADEPATRQHNFARWEKEIAAFEAKDREQPPQPGGIVFVGSSTMRLWKTAELLSDLPITNRGFGGSEMIDSAHFAERIVVPYRPRVVLVYAGSNDLSKNVAPCQVHADFISLADTIHASLPETEVVFLSVKPTVRRWPIIHRVRALNALVASTCQERPHLHFLDVFPSFLNDQGEPDPSLLAKDGLHLNEAGYQRLSALVRPRLQEWLSAAPAPAAAAPAASGPSSAPVAPCGPISNP